MYSRCTCFLQFIELCSVRTATRANERKLVTLQVILRLRLRTQRCRVVCVPPVLRRRSSMSTLKSATNDYHGRRWHVAHRPAGPRPSAQAPGDARCKDDHDDGPGRAAPDSLKLTSGSIKPTPHRHRRWRWQRQRHWQLHRHRHRQRPDPRCAASRPQNQTRSWIRRD